MLEGTKENKIYIVVSQTGSFPSRLLKLITRDKYNHVSISLEEDLDIMYSFARRYTYNPFWGGFVQESINRGTLKRFHKTKSVIMAVPVDSELYSKMKKYLEEMYLERKKYHYNYLGVALAGIDINFQPENHYYCSSFVKDLLVSFELIEADEMRKTVHPIDFIEKFGEQEIYCGRLQDYRV